MEPVAMPKAPLPEESPVPVLASVQSGFAGDWAYPLPMHLARFDADSAEPHILRGLD